MLKNLNICFSSSPAVLLLLSRSNICGLNNLCRSSVALQRLLKYLQQGSLVTGVILLIYLFIYLPENRILLFKPCDTSPWLGGDLGAHSLLSSPQPSVSITRESDTHRPPPHGLRCL